MIAITPDFGEIWSFSEPILSGQAIDISFTNQIAGLDARVKVKNIVLVIFSESCLMPKEEVLLTFVNCFLYLHQKIILFMSDSGDHPNCGNCLECRYDCCFSNRNCGESHIFGILTPDELHALMDNKRQIHFRPGETIMKQNTPLTHLVCIKNGLAKVVSEGPKGKNLILQIIKSNSIFTGGGAIVDDFRHFTVAAITDIDCCFIDTSRLYSLLTKNSTFSIELLKHSNSQHMKMLSTLINLTNKYMPGRVADTLLYLKDNIFETNPFNFILSKQELADMSGMTKESFIRSLKEFEDSGLIRQNRNTIEILKESDLIEISRNG